MVGRVGVESSEYPVLLRKIPDPPSELYYKGTWNPGVFSSCVAVVGSRQMSLYGKRAVKRILSTLQPTLTIVSGFMYGVDAEAHRVAIKLGLKTIVVMPCGINYIHPEDQKDLYKKVLDSGGLIVSEYPSNFKPKLWTYPRRNRIVAGLSRVVVIVEAALGSGSLITANLAHSYGRGVFVVPGSIFSDLSQGKVQLSNLFAKSIDSGCYINKYLGLDSKDEGVKEYKDNPILYLLDNHPLTVDELSENLSKSVSEISLELTSLSLDGLVSEEGGRFYAC